MFTIRLIVTGDVEHLALTDSLESSFPTTGTGERVEFLKPTRALSATSSRLRAGVPPGSPMQQLAKTLVTEARFSKERHGAPPDHVIAIDDLELANQEHAAIVISHMRRAVGDVIVNAASFPDERARIADAVRARCSFHLFAPMIEAYFFGERAAIQRAGSSETPVLVGSDVEDFETNDADWLPTCRLENARRHATAPWWRHERHPKHYLEHLVERDGGVYTETSAGRSALEVLDWKLATTHGAAFVRALFEDISTRLDVPNPLGPGPTAPETWPTSRTRRDQLTLRNL
jgi:hypothetical protein